MKDVWEWEGEVCKWEAIIYQTLYKKLIPDTGISCSLNVLLNPVF